MPLSKHGSHKSDHNHLANVGTVSFDLEVPTTSEVVFKHTWSIKKYNRTLSKLETIDSPVLKCSINNMVTLWNLSIRFWKGANGKRVKNPIVLCLNLAKCEVEESGQVKVRFQFGVWDAKIKHWECCPVNRIALNMENRDELLSVGYKDLSIRKDHIDSAGDVSLMVKIQIIEEEEERHCLSQDLSRVMARDENSTFFDTEILCAAEKDNPPLRAHSFMVKARCPLLSCMLREVKFSTHKNIKYSLPMTDLTYELCQELLRYIYTDKVDNIDSMCSRLLPMATRYGLPGLSALCEKALLDSLTPQNVASVLLLADQCGCANLRKQALHYCEESDEIKENVHGNIGKTLAWKVMEMVNPELFLEACESLGSSCNSNLDSSGSGSGEQM